MTVARFIRYIFRPSNRRPIAVTLVCLALLGAWGTYGSKIISHLNPRLGRELAIASHPPLSVWVTPPEYIAASPTIISTPAGVRFEEGTLDIPQGSIVSAHLAESDGEAPELLIDDNRQDFSLDNHGNFAVTQQVMSGHKLVIRRGWLTLASWKINVVADAPPEVALTAPPSLMESKTIRLSYTASDDLGVKEVSLRVTPHNPLPGSNNSPIEILLPVTVAKQISQVEFEDLTSRPWAGQKVTLQMVATNEAGKRTLSEGFDFIIPERSFFHPVARLLIEERKKLLSHPEDQALREETANVMASIAHETADYHGDPVVLMALRSGAVRLILGHDLSSVVSVNDLLWQTAARIEDGNVSTSQHMLRDAREDLANAIRRNASQQEVDALTLKLRNAMGAYVGHLKDQRDIAGGMAQNDKKPQSLR